MKAHTIYGLIGWFMLRAVILYALFIWGWSYILYDYVNVLTPFANKELQIIGVAHVSKLGPSPNPNFEVGVYHRDAAGMQDSLFDFKLESLRSHVPMLLALVLATPISWKRQLKAASLGVLAIYIIDSLACILILTWSYTFLPDHHHFTPFSVSPVRDWTTNFFYNFYNAIGVGVLPLIVWALTSLRVGDYRRYFGTQKLTARNH